jgi:RNA polymerase sigma-70 factor (ECF subfamily)
MAEDAVQESFIRAFKYINKFDFSKPFKHWFTKIVVNQSKKVLKKRFIWTEINDYQSFESECSSTEDKASQREEISSLMEEMARLPEKYRITIILKYFGGFSESEIGLILGLPASTIKSRLYTGRMYLKKGLTIGQEV